VKVPDAEVMWFAAGSVMGAVMLPQLGKAFTEFVLQHAPRAPQTAVLLAFNTSSQHCIGAAALYCGRVQPVSAVFKSQAQQLAFAAKIGWEVVEFAGRRS